MKVVILVIAFLINLSLQICENNGVPYNQSSEELCKCTPGFLGKNCNITAYELSDKFTKVPLSENYTYAYLTPAEKMIFRFGLTVCPAGNKDQVIDFILYAQEEQSDGSIITSPTNSKDFVEEVVGGHYGCQEITSTILISVDMKDNQEQPKIVFGFKLLPKNNETTIEFIEIKCEMYEIFTLNFLISLTTALLVIIALLMFFSAIITLRKKYLERRAAMLENQMKQEKVSRIMPSQKYQEFLEENELPVEENGNQNCSICLCEFKMSENIRKTPCGHIYHDKCLDSWCASHLNCPICRKNFEEEEKTKEVETVNLELREINNTNIREAML